MRSIALILILSLLAGCKSHKNVVHDSSSNEDSIATSVHHRSIFALDSLFRHIDFSFDSLKINIVCPIPSVVDTMLPSSSALPPKVLNLSVYRGHIRDSTASQRLQLENDNRLDSLAFHRHSSENSEEHSATTFGFVPPDGTLILVLSIAMAILFLLVWHRKN